MRATDRRGTRYPLSPAAREAVLLAHRDAAAAAVAQAAASRAAADAEVQAFVASCVGAEDAALAPEWVGQPETVLSTLDLGTAPRVLGEDGECFARTDDHRPDRLNLLLAGGVVVWAGRF